MERKPEPERNFGRTGIKVPLIGYGTAPLGKPGIPRDLRILCLNHASDRGIAYVDTSPDYGSEPVVGDVMKVRRNETFLATKVSLRKADGVLRELERVLENPRTDRIDLVQVHATSAMTDPEQALFWLHDAIVLG